MPNTDLTDTTAANKAVPEEPKKSDAASRILRAVEKSRSGEATQRLQIPAALPPPSGEKSASEPTSTEPLPKLVMPKIGVDAREALRSLSQQSSLEKSGSGRVVGGASSIEPGPASEVPLKDRTVSEILRDTKPAETAPLPGEKKPTAAVPPPPEPQAVPAAGAEPQVAAEKPAANRKEGGSKSGRHAKVAAKAGAKAATSGAQSSPQNAPQTPASKAAEPAVTPGRTTNPAFEAPLLGMGPNPNQSFWATMPMVVKAGLGVLVLGLVAGVLFKFSGNPANAKPGARQQQAKTNRTPVPMSGIGGWTANWGDPSKMNGRSISLFRPSLQHADYRIEFEGQIEAKAFGWVFRAKDPQNYYGYKIETVKPGLQPLVALARITVVAGVESQKHYTLIETPVRPDTVFRIRMDAIESEFTTRVNDQLIEVWQDDRLRFGGVGLFSDPGERAQIRKVQISEMR